MGNCGSGGGGSPKRPRKAGAAGSKYKAVSSPGTVERKRVSVRAHDEPAPLTATASLEFTPVRSAGSPGSKRPTPRGTLQRRRQEDAAAMLAAATADEGGVANRAMTSSEFLGFFKVAHEMDWSMGGGGGGGGGGGPSASQSPQSVRKTLPYEDD
eukprot:Rhum_TRINITY_DN10979_c1_g1::Rhum_TRINITY_DN10979_c1_g1_i1::g.41663::m.41663